MEGALNRPKDKIQALIEGKGVFVIAEIGKNFIDTEAPESVEMYIEKAKKLIDAAAEAGADAVKFQTHEVEDEQLDIPVVSPHFKGAERYAWVKRNTEATPHEFWKEVREHAQSRNVIFFSTPMSRGAVHKLLPYEPELWKVGSGDIEDFVMLDSILDTGKPVIISTGMTSFEELDGVVKLIRSRNVPLIILYCVSKYPSPKEDFNLGSIEVFKERYPDAIIGFSDHSVDGHEVDLAAIKAGARVIEKHFSFSRDLWGSDHKASITPAEMKAMIDAIRAEEFHTVDLSAYYGQKDKRLEGAESQFRPYFNKGLVAAKDIPAGKVIEKSDVYAMRPVLHIQGLPSKEFHSILGKRLKRSVEKHTPFSKDHFE